MAFREVHREVVISESSSTNDERVQVLHPSCISIAPHRHHAREANASSHRRIAALTSSARSTCSQCPASTSTNSTSVPYFVMSALDMAETLTGSRCARQTREGEPTFFRSSGISVMCGAISVKPGPCDSSKEGRERLTDVVLQVNVLDLRVVPVQRRLDPVGHNLLAERLVFLQEMEMRLSACITLNRRGVLVLTSSVKYDGFPS